MMVTGGRDGSINVWSCHRGRHLQAIEKAHSTNPHSSKGESLPRHGCVKVVCASHACPFIFALKNMLGGSCCLYLFGSYSHVATQQQLDRFQKQAGASSATLVITL